MLGLPWRQARGQRIGAASYRRGLSFELERPPAGRSVRTNSQDHAADFAGKTDAPAERRYPRLCAELQQISGGENRAVSPGRNVERNSFCVGETGSKEIVTGGSTHEKTISRNRDRRGAHRIHRRICGKAKPASHSQRAHRRLLDDSERFGSGKQTGSAAVRLQFSERTAAR